jgi:formylglycine-generating enzyme required for sulfatase activity
VLRIFLLLMKSYSIIALAAAVLGTSPARAEAPSTPFVYETAREFIGQSDFDGDGRIDVVVVDKETGKIRLGYQLADGIFSWVDNRPTGIKGISGFTIGRFTAAKTDGLAFTSPDANQITTVDVSSTSASARPVTIPFESALGPNTVVGVEIGGAGNTPALDFFVGSIYNSPDPNQATLVRNNGSDFPKLADIPLGGPAVHGNRVAIKAGQPEALAYIVSEDAGDALKVENLTGDKPVTVVSQGGLPKGSAYAVGHFSGGAAVDFVVYKPGENGLRYLPIEEAGGKTQFGKGASFDMGQPIREVVTLSQPAGELLLVVLGQGDKAVLFSFDGKQAPAQVQAFAATNDVFTGAASVKDGLVLFTQPSTGKYSTRYLKFVASGKTYVPGPYGSLSTMADNDNITIPDIHARITAKTPASSEAEMAAYTNTIPGTRAKFVMVPIKGGEFLMGTPEVEPNRKPDEGPQHKVKISPFWMGQCEITWNEYELFMYSDEEKRMRETVPTDAAGDKLADAVTHPSKPYVEMSFGMGKDGFPAISMTQHAANKYCQWLSAKTGQFYRLPTEAEWEYACRAGTTTVYSFGDDASKLPDYGWFEQNSDFKYQKVGKKKPNPWGLYDMHGNVVEWVLDQYDPELYKKQTGVVADPWNKATKPYPHAVKGGSWDDEATRLRSGARRGSDRAWKMQDPQLPKSIWYFSDAQFVGFRIVRPLKVPSAEDMQKYWSSGVERD